MQLGNSLQLDHYELILQGQPPKPVALSEDGSGITYRARDAQSGKSVIIRLFSERLLSDSVAQQDFVTRARFLIELEHPAITRIIDTGQSENRFFYVLEDPGGETVRQLVANAPLRVDVAMELHRQLVEALIALRPRPDAVPRVWPGNLLVTLDPKPRLCILAQNLVDSTPPIEDPEFVAPEVLRGERESVQSLLYSVGATLYHMLTGQPPYPRQQDISALAERMTRSTPDFSKLPPGSPVGLIRRLLSPDPQRRPASLFDWDAALQEVLRKGLPPAGVDTNAAAASDREVQLTKQLEETRAHTQRLSVELTKRVQRELEMSFRLKQLESELERERLAAHQQKQDGRPEEIERLRREKDRLAAEWQRLEKAQRDLERDRQAFLEKTQRLSFSGPQMVAGASAPGGERTERDAARPGHRSSGPPPGPPKEPTKAETETGSLKKSDSEMAAARLAEASTAPGTGGSQEAKAQAAPGEEVDLLPADVLRFAKPKVRSTSPGTGQKPPDSTAEKRSERSSIPVGKATSAIRETAPRSQGKTSPMARKGTGTTLSRASGRPRPPEVVPTRCGWPTLIVCTLLLGSTLYFMPFRTFFASRPDLPDTEEGSEFPEPVSVDVEPPVSESGGGEPPEAEPLNQDLWVETKVMENFRLIQNQEWAELLHGLKRLETQWGDKYPESVAKIREVLGDDLHFTGELGTPDHVKKNEAYQELVRYLEAAGVFPPAAAGDAVQDPRGSSSNHSSSGSNAGIGTLSNFNPLPTAR